MKISKILVIFGFFITTNSFADSALTNFSLSSRAFNNGENIPQEFTGDGEDLSPPLEWKNVPKATKSLAIIMDDPDAPSKSPWVHWIVYNIAPNVSSLTKGVKVNTLPPCNMFSTSEGRNSWEIIPGYKGPFPPKDQGTHHYHFTLYALDTHLEIQSLMPERKIVEGFMNGHVIGKAELIGTYSR